ncbi:hypothetical protein D3C87_1605050 [compost metagenome]
MTLAAVEFERQVERRHQALHDGKSQPQPLGHARAAFKPRELGEHEAMLVAVEPNAGIDNVQPPAIATLAQPHQHLATHRRVLDGVRHQVLHDPSNQRAIGQHVGLCGHDAQ